jgi:hypothetical protein
LTEFLEVCQRTDSAKFLIAKTATQVDQNEARMWEEEGNLGFLRMDYDPVTQVKSLIPATSCHHIAAGLVSPPPPPGFF